MLLIRVSPEEPGVCPAGQARRPRPDQAEALARSVQALHELRVEGVATTRDVHLRLLVDSAVRDGPVTTSWLEGYLQKEQLQE